ncbi:DUF2434 domain-containing protein [Aspergillus affinis]|uniref:DUF2434 domain-containing protein n=1 Tax=Aspergillus affinis TaxID=1070780 RepID=UPI0022FE16D2|nr:uncharacterized protein KD926_001300 [Aspergillus affinis]KAI9036778.1 hypothetical protein KD926_001300 [Aspergillus affinis]
MNLLTRALASLPTGANDTDVLINTVHFDRDALNLYNYTLYTNGTLSNGTECYLIFDQFKPHLFAENGTVVNGTSCYAPVNQIGQHASIGMAFALMFALSIFFTLINVRKHGRQYLPVDPRRRVLGRKMKWYWLLVVAVCGTISCFMSIDVDRSYLQSAPLIIQSVFYTMLMPALMAAVWEAVRQWGSWQERQICDRDPYVFTNKSNSSGNRSRQCQEFLLPILFYAFALINFVLTIPRSWSPIEHQQSPEQQELDARPVATDTRFRVAAFTALAGMLVICCALEHSIYRYKARPATILGQLLFYFNEAPSQFLVLIALLGVKIGYAIASAFDWSVSPLRYDVDVGWLYGLGYTPVLLVIVVMNMCGFCELNEDQALIAQRGDLEAARASKFGIGRKKPSWWSNAARWTTFARDGGDRPSSPDKGDLDHFVEMGVIKPRALDEQQEAGEEKKPGEGARVTTRTASHGSSELSGTESASGDRMEVVVQEEQSGQFLG